MLSGLGTDPGLGDLLGDTKLIAAKQDLTHTIIVLIGC